MSSELEYFRRDEVQRLRDEHDAAVALVRQQAVVIGLLREAVGGLWTVVHAANDERDCESFLPESSYETALGDADRLMAQVDRLQGLAPGAG